MGDQRKWRGLGLYFWLGDFRYASDEKLGQIIGWIIKRRSFACGDGVEALVGFAGGLGELGVGEIGGVEEADVVALPVESAEGGLIVEDEIVDADAVGEGGGLFDVIAEGGAAGGWNSAPR